MKLHLVAIATTAALTAGLGMASGADHQAMQKTSSSPAMHSMAKDSLP